eukprot:13237514-Alexandrium_andersonii.AAC.1
MDDSDNLGGHDDSDSLGGLLADGDYSPSAAWLRVLPQSVFAKSATGTWLVHSLCELLLWPGGALGGQVAPRFNSSSMLLGGGHLLEGGSDCDS